MKNFLFYVFASFFGASIALIFLTFFILGIAGSLGGEKTKSIKNGTVLELDLSVPILERTSKNPFSELLMGEKDAVGLQRYVRALEKAAADEKIAGVYVKVGLPDAGMATLETLRNALLEFKKSKKFVYAYGETMTERSYYVASVADSIWLFPSGMLEWNGLNANPMFVRGMLDKLGIEPRVFKVGAFKSAAEMFTEKQMSPANREQIQTLLDDMWKHMLAGVSAARNVDVATLDTLSSTLGVTRAQHAVRHKLIDGLLYEDQVKEKLKKAAKTDQDDKLPTISLADYDAAQKYKKSDNKIAVVYAVGEINSGEGDENSIGSETIVKAIREAREDKNVKAVVLRVNSPGGSALASDVIGREIDLTKKEKPVIASYGDVAASGGYWISAKCDAIVSEPTTITGSIGVIGLWANTQKFFNDKLGVTFDRVYSTNNRYADIGDPNKPMSEYEARVLQREVNVVYGDFIRRVQEGRNFPDSASVDAIAQGRVWTGMRAKDLKLVDEIGSLNTAVKLAAKKAGVADDYELVPYPKYKSKIERVMEKLTGAATAKFFSREEVRALRAVRYLLDSPSPIHARMDWDLDIR
jgi:protease-4